MTTLFASKSTQIRNNARPGIKKNSRKNQEKYIELSLNDRDP